MTTTRETHGHSELGQRALHTSLPESSSALQTAAESGNNPASGRSVISGVSGESHLFDLTPIREVSSVASNYSAAVAARPACSRCGVNPRRERHSWCQQCLTDSNRRYAKANRDKLREKSRRQYWSNRDDYSRRSREWTEKHPQADLARRLVAQAIAKRLLVPTPCQECGSEANVEAHHDDYTRPLDVRWLCRSCHRRHHTQPPTPGAGE